MSELLLVGLGGFLGASARYLLGTVIVDRLGAAFPWHTLTINLTGSLLIGVIMALLIERSLVDGPLRLFVVVGFLGGYTTFSSYTFEAVSLLERGDWGKALLYALGSNALGLIATFAGLAITRGLTR